MNACRHAFEHSAALGNLWMEIEANFDISTAFAAVVPSLAWSAESSR